MFELMEQHLGGQKNLCGRGAGCSGDRRRRHSLSRCRNPGPDNGQCCRIARRDRRRCTGPCAGSHRYPQPARADRRARSPTRQLPEAISLSSRLPRGQYSRRFVVIDFDDIDFDAPNSYVRRSVTRPNARRLTQGRGQYVDDIVLPRMVHVAYVRSPHAHAKIVRIETKKAEAMPGVVRIATGAEIALVCKPYVGVLTHLQGMRSPPQYPLAMEVARWQGEPVVAVVAQSRAEAEDAVDAVEVRYEELPAALDAERALDPSEPKIHKQLDSTLCFQSTVDTGGGDAAMKSAHLVVEDTIQFGRHNSVTIEPRAILADYNRAEESMTVYHCGQSPHMMQGIIASRLSLD